MNNELLVIEKEFGILHKIKSFFTNFFKGKREDVIIEDVLFEEDNVENDDRASSNNESEEEKLLELQRKYRNGEVKEEDMTDEQVNALCDLFRKQIDSLSKSNELRKQKLLKYKMKMQESN